MKTTTASPITVSKIKVKGVKSPGPAASAVRVGKAAFFRSARPSGSVEEILSDYKSD